MSLDHQHLIDTLVQASSTLIGATTAYVVPGYQANRDDPLVEELRKTAYGRDLALIAAYAESQLHDLAAVRQAIYRVHRQVVGLVGRLLAAPAGGDISEEEVSFADTFTFIAAMTRSTPQDFQETALGRLVNQAYGMMVSMADTMQPTEVMRALGCSRQRVYDLTREGKLVAIYTPAGKTQSMRAVYFARQVEEMKSKSHPKLARAAAAKKPRAAKPTKKPRRPKAASVLSIHP